MKYGLLVFKQTDNIGDDIQAYAAEAFLPHIDYYIDRESLNVFKPRNEECVATIMNAWYMYNKYTFSPSPYIYPLFISMHFSKSDYFMIEDDCLDLYMKEYFDQYGAIGCRDSCTKEIFLKKGIKAFFSGCLTLTIEPKENITKKNIIYCVDVDENVVDKVKELNVNCQIEKITHDIKPEMGEFVWDDRKKRVEELLKKYQSAYCVITTRLHCALPCLALGTPVLLLYQDEEYFKNRMEDFLPFLHYCDEKNFLNGYTQYDINNPPPNSTKFENLKDELKRRVKDFVGIVKYEEKKKQVGNDYWYEQLFRQSELLKKQLPKLKELHDKAWEREKLVEKSNWQDNEIQWLKSKINGTEEYYKNREKWIEQKLNNCESENRILQEQLLEQEKNIQMKEREKEELFLQKEEIIKKYDLIYSSKTYRYGNIIFGIPRKIWSFIKKNRK